MSEKVKSFGHKFPKPHFPWPVVTDEMREAVLKQLDDSISIYNRSGVVKEFEDAFRLYHGRKFGFIMNSGTSALLSSFVGIGIAAGDEVICPTYTFFATASPLMILGAVPVFADALTGDGNIDPADIERKISEKTKAVIVTHMWGIPCEMDSIVRICHKYKLRLVEDCSHAHGAEYKGKKVGTFGDVAAWSLQSQKVVAGGQAGVLLTDDEDIYARAQLLSSFNKRCFQEIPTSHPLYSFALSGFGLNHRVHPLAAAIANQQFKHLDTWLNQKRIYIEEIIQSFQNIKFLEPPSFPERKHTGYALVFQFKPQLCKVSIDEFIERTHALGLWEFERPRSTGPIHGLSLFTEPQKVWPVLYSNSTLREQGKFPIAEEYYENAVKLPVWVNPEDHEIVRAYIDGILEVAQGVGKLISNDD